MSDATITREEFLKDRQGRTFADVLNDAEQPFGDALALLNDPDIQRRMEEAELHHDRAPLAGVVRQLESHSEIGRFLSTIHERRSQRFRQSVGVLIRMIMERRGWHKTGRKGSLGVRSQASVKTPNHNTGGLAFWFLRAERYEPQDGMPFQSVRQRCRELESVAPKRKHSDAK